MPGVRVDADNCPVEPIVTPPILRVEKYLNPVADLNFVCHLLAASPEQDQPDPDDNRDRAINRPLRIACHKTAGQDVDSLQHPYCTGKDQ